MQPLICISMYMAQEVHMPAGRPALGRRLEGPTEGPGKHALKAWQATQRHNTTERRWTCWGATVQMQPAQSCSMRPGAHHVAEDQGQPEGGQVSGPRTEPDHPICRRSKEAWGHHAHGDQVKQRHRGEVGRRAKKPSCPFPAEQVPKN